jgi:DNA-binding MarR family transcriptional regulator
MGELLFLDSGTLSPLLKKMIQKKLIIKKRNPNDERNIQICLSPSGEKLVHKIELIPEKMANDYAYLHSKLEEMKGVSNNLIQEFKK